MHPKCVCCGSNELVLIGAIPASIYFAGRYLDLPLQGGNLFRCLNCQLVFRYPQLSKEELDRLYCQGNPINWQTAPETRKDWEIAIKWISQNMPGANSILDVGCFDGGFLRFVGADYSRFGIEIHDAARRAAQESGVQIIGADFASLTEATASFDVVTAFDVIEHVNNPMYFLEKLAMATRKKGIVIVSSGNSEAYGWRLLGAHYWYCVIGEHLAFINPKWCAWAAPRVGLELKLMATFSHSDTTIWQQAIDTLKNLIYAFSPRGFALLRLLGLGGDVYRVHKELLNYPPNWISAKDHCIYLLEKK